MSIANPGDTINFTSAVTTCSPIVLTSGPITISKDLMITGPGPGDVAVSGNRNSQVFVVSAGAIVSISGITVEDGVSNAYCFGPCGTSGGGIDTSGDLTLTNVVVTDNETNLGCVNYCGANGGGIENEIGGTLAIVDSTLTGNIAGGIFSGCTDNCGDSGGAIENLGTLTVTDSTVSDNSANERLCE